MGNASWKETFGFHHHRALAGMGRLCQRGDPCLGPCSMQAVPSPLTSCCFYIEDGLLPKQVCYFTGPEGQGESLLCGTPVFLRRGELARATLIREGHLRCMGGSRQSTPALLSEKSPDLLEGKGAAKPSPEVMVGGGAARTQMQRQRRECQACRQGCFKQGSQS